MKRLLTLGAVALLLTACGSGGDSSDTTASDEQIGLSVPTQTTVIVDGTPLTCVTVVGYSNYGGGISCDWDGWHAARGDQ